MCTYYTLYTYGEVYVRTRCAGLSGHTRPSSALFVNRGTCGVGIFSPRHNYTFCFFVSFCFVLFFCETVKSRYPWPERLTYTGALTGWLAHITIVPVYNIRMSYLPSIMRYRPAAASPRNMIASAYRRGVNTATYHL